MDSRSGITAETVTSTQTELTKSARREHRHKTISNRTVKVTTLVSESESENESETERSYDTDKSVTESTDGIEHTTESDSGESSHDISDSVSNDSSSDLFDVEDISSIRAFRIDNALTRQFLIKWEGYQRESWVDESDLHCPDILEKFFEKRGSTEVEPMAGASTETNEYNLDNWVTPSRLLKATNSYRNSNRHRAEIEIKLFHNLENNDTIYIIQHECHYFVLMHYHKKGIGYISDGGNLFAQNIIIRRQIKCILKDKIKLISLHNTAQRTQDYCGSTAAALAITFLQRYRTNRWINPITIAPTLVNRLANLLHKHPSMTFCKQEINNHAIYCRSCGKRFYKSTRHAAHERFCRPSNN